MAEEFRAFGFPLTDQLGESIRITRGTVSGINEQEGSKVFELDVTVNPGNSGGPLMNEKGHVMSFAVTSNDVRKLMDRYQLKFALANSADQVLSGPDLAENVTKLVGLIKVTMGPGGIGIAEKKVIQYDGRWSTYEKTGSSRRSRGSTSEKGVVLVDSTGEVSYCSGDKNLPGHLGLVAMVGLQPLSDDESNDWRSARVTVIPETKTVTIPTAPTSNPYSPYSRFGRNRFGSRPQSQTLSATRMHPAIEVTTFKLSRTSGDIVDIQKKLELITMSGEDSDRPYMHVNGSGTFKFDKRQGIPQSLDFSATMDVATSSGVGKIPVKLSFKTLNAETLAQSDAESRKRLAEAQARAREAAAKRAAELAAKAIPIVKRLDKLDLSE